jgi:UDP-3-O-[3-hydroxymyristoyl] glucosamine N-acyltransferase
MKVEELALLLDGKLAGDGEKEIAGIAGVESAGPADLTFADGERALGRAAASAAGCILIPASAALPGKTAIAVKHPKLALIRAAEALLKKTSVESGVHATAIVAKTAQLAPSVAVGPHVSDAASRSAPIAFSMRAPRSIRASASARAPSFIAAR